MSQNLIETVMFSKYDQMTYIKATKHTNKRSLYKVQMTVWGSFKEQLDTYLHHCFPVDIFGQFKLNVIYDWDF